MSNDELALVELSRLTSVSTQIFTGPETHLHDPPERLAVARGVPNAARVWERRVEWACGDE